MKLAILTKSRWSTLKLTLSRKAAVFQSVILLAMASEESLPFIFSNSYNRSSVLLKTNEIVTLHIEICQRGNSNIFASDIEAALEKYFMNEKEFVLNRPLFDTVLPSDIEYVRICSTDGRHKINFLTEKTVKHYHIYQTWDIAPQIDTIYVGKDEYSASLNWSLPNIAFEGLWESLVIENGLKEELMSYVQTALLYSGKQVNAKYVLWNGVVLFHGPPGTGKTSLCKAVAQKLSIWLNSKYKSSQLIEVNSHSLFSKWYSESAKVVHKLFETITAYLYSEDHFLCILIDEVESLTQGRNSSRSDPSDSVKVVNTVLTQIDQLQRHPNFLILATSNVTDIIDTAFADRADLKLHIPYPSRWGVYEIYRSCLEELISRDLVKGNKNDFFEGVIFEHMNFDAQDEGNSIVNEIMENSKALLKVSIQSKNLGGRTLRKIPFLTSAKFLNTEIPNVLEFLETMSQVVSTYISRNKEFFKI